MKILLIGPQEERINLVASPKGSKNMATIHDAFNREPNKVCDKLIFKDPQGIVPLRMLSLNLV